MCKVSEGDVELTPEGHQFVDADIAERKELFGKAALERVTLIRQIKRALESKSNHTLPDEFFHDTLDEHFSEDETIQQLDTAINWGRYAGLFDYDSATRKFYIPDEESEAVSGVSVIPPGLSRQFSLDRTWPFILDVLVFATVLAAFYGVLTIAHYWLGQAIPVTEISRSPWSLPRYAFYSLVRMGIAYFLSLLFAVTYGRIAAYNKTLQPFMVAILDILQSIPVLSFLPGVMLAMVALFPE